MEGGERTEPLQGRQLLVRAAARQVALSRYRGNVVYRRNTLKGSTSLPHTMHCTAGTAPLVRSAWSKVKDSMLRGTSSVASLAWASVSTVPRLPSQDSRLQPAGSWQLSPSSPSPATIRVMMGPRLVCITPELSQHNQPHYDN